MTRCGLNFSVFGFSVCRPVTGCPGVTTPVFPLIVSGLLPLPIRLLISRPGETSLLHLPACHGPPHLLSAALIWPDFGGCSDHPLLSACPVWPISPVHSAWPAITARSAQPVLPARTGWLASYSLSSTQPIRFDLPLSTQRLSLSCSGSLVS